MSSDVSHVRSMSPEEKRALLQSLLQREPVGARVAPLSFAQQRLWFLEALENLGGTYHVPLRWSLTGPLDTDALRRALDRIVARHEILRTTFGEVDGKPVQRVAPARPNGFPLAEHDLRGAPNPRAALHDLVAEEAGTRFDLSAGPLIRGRLVRLAEDEHALLITMHHIVSDGWSMGVFARELGALYAAFSTGADDPLPALPTQYADYAAWQRGRVQGELLERQAEFWTRALAGAPELLELPADRPRPARQDFAGGSVPLALDAELTAALKALSRRHGTTLFMTLLAGWAAVLARLSGQGDVVIGTPTAGRERRETEALIGFFIHTLALRLDLTGTPTVAELLARVRSRSLEAQQHQDIPFEQVVERVRPARSLAHTPLFQVMFAWQDASGGSVSLPGLTVAPLEPPREGATAKFDLMLELAEVDGRIAGGLNYATALFDRPTVERHVGYLRRVLEEMAADEHRPVDRLELLSAAERARVVAEWNATDAEYPADACIHQLFEAQAARTPNAVAVTFDGDPLPYAELNARANRLAHHLTALGVGPGARIGLCLERGAEMVVALLATLKAGGAYVPLDPDAPAERLHAMLADSTPTVLLTQAALRDRFHGIGIPALSLDADASTWADQPTANPAIDGLTPDHLAYVIYTSGSTGTPKGVMNAHRGVINRLAWMERAYRLGADEAVLQKTPYTFDVSVWEFFWPLMTGARLVMARPGGHRDPSYLVDTIRDENITTLHFVPSMLRTFLDAESVETCASLRRVVCSGEALPATLVRRFHGRLPGVELHNLYGPTEAAVDVTAWRCAAGETEIIPIGRPMANVRIYLLDGRMAPVPTGVAGELYIGGIQVARGYLNRPTLTAERFVADPFSADPGARLYRTGDLARWLADGSIEYLGRNDFQVKVRGFRIEPGEIEARLAEHPSVHEAVVIACENGPGEKRLVAYVAADDIDAEALRTHLSARLPEYMVPAAYVRLDALPLTSSGKLDRKALPAPEGDAYARRGYEPPVGRTEEALAAACAEVLGVERVGRRDHFFDLGGHSLMALRLIARLREVLDARIVLADVFAHPTLDALAARLDGTASADLGDRAVPIRASGSARPLFMVHEATGSIAYLQVIRPHLDPEVPLYGLPVAPRTHPILQTAREMAARHARMIRQVQPEGPYRVAGWSWGGVLAWALAAQLIAEGHEVEFLGMLDTYHPASIPPPPDPTGYHLRLLLLSLFRLERNAPVAPRESLRALKTATDGGDWPLFIDRAHAMGLLDEEVTLADAQQLLRHLQARSRAILSYDPRPLAIPAHLFLTEDPGSDDRGWKGKPASATLRVVPVPGTHHTMLSPGNVEVLGAALSRTLRAASNGRRDDPA